jgi:hypothetical protein
MKGLSIFLMAFILLYPPTPSSIDIDGALGDLDITESEASEINQETKEDILEIDGTTVSPAHAKQHIIHGNKLDESWYSLYIVMGLFITTLVSLRMVTKSIESNPKHKPEDTISGSALIIIIMATLILVMSATTLEAMTPAFSVFTGIGGYIFGRTMGKEDAQKSIGNKNDK